MQSRCPLCRRSVPGDAQRWCRCGQVMDSRCHDAHRFRCAVSSSDAWIGALEY